MSKKLLLADDSITIQKVVGIIFANEDYELTVVDNGDAALEKARQIVPDIILVDALMPGKNGYEVCAGVRQDPTLSATPLLLMTGAFEPFDEDKARQSGADDFISKPFESQQLIDRVKKLIELGKERGAGPAAAPSAAMVSPEPPVPSVPAVAAPAMNDLAEAFAVEPVVEEKAEEVFALGDEAVEGTLDDDLWGAFEMEELPTAGIDDIGAVAEPVAAPAATTAVEDAFSFADINDDLGRGAVTEAPAVEVPPVETGWEPVDEQSFTFEEEEPAGTGQISELPAAVDEAFEFAPEPEEPAPAMDFSFEDTVETVEELSSPAIPDTIPAQAAFAAAGEPIPPSRQPGLTEAQLKAALSGISREIIEKIVWEVVPDLAEALIKEEIRKLKEGSGN